MKIALPRWTKLLVVSELILLAYLLAPGPQFPQQIPGSLKSDEPADVESPLRQGFYTDWDRAQIMDYFKEQFSKSSWLGLSLLTERLNYPPEEAQTIIRDQTRSRYLEEFAHPLRESLFVNGFFAQKDTEVMIVNGHRYKTKVTVRMIPSDLWVRSVVGGVALFLGFVTVANLAGISKELKNV